MDSPSNALSEKPDVDSTHSVDAMANQDAVPKEKDQNYKNIRAERIRRFYGWGGSSANGSFRDDETASEGGASFDSEFEFNLRSVRSLAALGLGGGLPNRNSSYPSLSNIFNNSRNSFTKRKLPSNHISSVLQVLPDCFSQFAETTPHLADLAPPYRSLWMSLVTVESFLASSPYCQFSSHSQLSTPVLALDGSNGPSTGNDEANDSLTLQHVKDLTILLESLSALLKRHLDVQSLVLIPWIKKKANVPLSVQSARDRLRDRLQSLDSLLNQILAAVEILESVQFSGPLDYGSLPSFEDMDELFGVQTLDSANDRDLDKFAPSPISPGNLNATSGEDQPTPRPEEPSSASDESNEKGVDITSADVSSITRAVSVEKGIPQVTYYLRQLLRRVVMTTGELCTQSASYLGDEWTSVTTFIEAHFSRNEWELFAPRFWNAWCASEGCIVAIEETSPAVSPLRIPLKQPPLLRFDSPSLMDNSFSGASSELNSTSGQTADQVYTPSQGGTPSLDEALSESEYQEAEQVEDQVESDAAVPVSEETSEPKNINTTTEDRAAEEDLPGLDPAESKVMNSPLNLAIFCKNLQNDEDMLKSKMAELHLSEPEPDQSAEVSKQEERQNRTTDRVLSEESQEEKVGAGRADRRSRAASLFASIKATLANIPLPSLGLGGAQGSAQGGAPHDDSNFRPSDGPHASRQNDVDGNTSLGASDAQSGCSSDSSASDPIKDSDFGKVTTITFPLRSQPLRNPLHPLRATKYDPNKHLKLLVPFFLQASKGHEEDKDWLLRRLPLTDPQRKLCLTEWVTLWEKEKVCNLLA